MGEHHSIVGDKKIAVIGLGYVGLPLARLFATRYAVVGFDINQKRIEEAKRYLERGNVSITEVALMVEFNDLNYFSRVFKKTTSLSPSQYSKHCFTET